MHLITFNYILETKTKTCFSTVHVEYWTSPTFLTNLLLSFQILVSTVAVTPNVKYSPIMNLKTMSMLEEEKKSKRPNSKLQSWKYEIIWNRHIQGPTKWLPFLYGIAKLAVLSCLQWFSSTSDFLLYSTILASRSKILHICCMREYELILTIHSQLLV